ncbi:hypothetical protein ACJJI4_16975 [Microbulbifer sp. TRSA002]|uniref:hypothetical protein n=1 Tax=Microbulbifer sp. TRSA002 TaxID=3243382 RepID=UPI00403A39C4
MPSAVPHSRIHRVGYYTWLELEFAALDIQDLNETEVEKVLKAIEYDLKFSSFPHYVMLPADEAREQAGV